MGRDQADILEELTWCQKDSRSGTIILRGGLVHWNERLPNRLRAMFHHLCFWSKRQRIAGDVLIRKAQIAADGDLSRWPMKYKQVMASSTATRLRPLSTKFDLQP